MKAIYFEEYGGPDVLRYGERPCPVPRRGQVLVQVRAAGVNPRDWLLREGKYVFQRLLPPFPLIPGSDVSGVVVAQGPGATRFALGAEVFGLQPVRGGMGGYAEYVAIAETALTAKPHGVSHAAATAVPCAGLTAYQALKHLGRVRPGSRVLVNGAVGGVGTFAVQIAKALGATVTAVTSAANVALLQKLGADRVVDYQHENFLHTVTNQDVVFDAIGRQSQRRCRRVLAPGGRYLTTIPGPGPLLHALLTGARRLLTFGRKASTHLVLVRANAPDLAQLAEWLAVGRVRSVIAATFPLADARLAQQQSRTWHTRGKLVLVVPATTAQE